MKNDFGELILEGCDINGNLRPGTHRYPAYTCGHCTKIVVLRPDRSRPRQHCLSCDRWICEENALCQEQCTPMHAMARDHFEGAGTHGRLVPAIMAGATNMEEAVQRGLVSAKE